MRRLGRILWTTFAAASLLLSAAAAGVWVRSYFVEDTLTATAVAPGGLADSADQIRASRATLVRTARGRVGIVRVGGVLAAAYALRQPGWRHDTSETADVDLWGSLVPWCPRAVDLPGIDYGEDRGGDPVVGALVVHLAYPTALFAVAPLAWLAGRRKRRRRAARARAGLCPSCGYDLRASPGRCPECGASAESKGEHVGRRGERGTP